MDAFFTYIQKFGIIPPQDMSILRRYAKAEKLMSGAFFLQSGQICHQVGFVLSGVLRVYVHNEEGKEITRGFSAEDQFMIDQESYTHQLPGHEFWEALTNVEYIYWTRDDIQKMEHELTSWQAILIPMWQHIFVSAAHERTEMFNDSASMRYSKFLTRYPHIVARVPLKHVASYLGIAPQSLSRIRQQVAKSSIN